MYCLRLQMHNPSQTPKYNSYTVLIQYSLTFYVYPSDSNLYNPYMLSAVLDTVRSTFHPSLPPQKHKMPHQPRLRSRAPRTPSLLPAVLKQPIAQTPYSNAGLGSNNIAAVTQQKNKAGLRRKYVFQRKLNGMRLQGYKLAIRTRENGI